MYTSSANSGLFSVPVIPWDSGGATGLSSDNIGFCSFLSPGLLAAYPQYLASVCAGFGTKRACRASLELGHGGPTAPQPRQRAWQPNSVNTTVIEQRRWSHPAPKLGPQLVRVYLLTLSCLLLSSEHTTTPE